MGKENLHLTLAKELIKIPSTKEDSLARGKVLDVASASLHGFVREKFEHNSVRSDLYYAGSYRPDIFRVLLHAHLDVVPAQKESQYFPRVEGDRLYGRGASDMKNGASVMINVFNELASKLPYSIGLCLTTDEEVGGFNGAGYQAEQGVRAQFAISGESTGFQIGNEHKGVLILELEATAKGGHTAHAPDSDNALLRLIRVQSKATEMYPGSDDSWRTTGSITKTETKNTAHNIAPSEAKGEIAFRWIAGDDPDKIEDNIAKLDPVVKVSRGPFAKAHLTNIENPDIQLLTKTIQSVLGQTAKFESLAGASDVRHFTDRGASGIDFGPIGEGLHTEEEYCLISSLSSYENILKKFLMDLRT